MGNNVVRYFLQFMKSYPNADEWIDTHIHVFLAVRILFYLPFLHSLNIYEISWVPLG